MWIEEGGRRREREREDAKEDWRGGRKKGKPGEKKRAWRLGTRDEGGSTQRQRDGDGSALVLRLSRRMPRQSQNNSKRVQVPLVSFFGRKWTKPAFVYMKYLLPHHPRGL
jgi:hypothetical protein